MKNSSEYSFWEPGGIKKQLPMPFSFGFHILKYNFDHWEVFLLILQRFFLKNVEKCGKNQKDARWNEESGGSRFFGFGAIYDG